jgi:mortality factor 4-like protein 1
MGDSGPFSVGEKVLVPHTDKFYEAKVQKAQRREDGLWYYFLHYLGTCGRQQQHQFCHLYVLNGAAASTPPVCTCHAGWNKKWDEWVEETGLKRPGEAVVSAPPGAAAAGGGPSQAGGPAGLGAASAPLSFGAASGAGAAAGAAVAVGFSKPKMKQRRGTSGETGGVLGSGGGGAGTHTPLLCCAVSMSRCQPVEPLQQQEEEQAWTHHLQTAAPVSLTSLLHGVCPHCAAVCV